MRRSNKTRTIGLKAWLLGLLFVGGGLFALPIVYEAMRTTIGNDGELVVAPKVKAITMDVQ